MQRSRTIKTLACLVIAMTIGTFALQVMETQPAGASLSPLAMSTNPDSFAKQVNTTSVPIQSHLWKNIIIHDSACLDITDFNRDCHFIVYGNLSAQAGLDGKCLPTNAWQSQITGQHINVPGCDFNSNSISICVEGDLTTQKLSQKQEKSLFGILHSLQRKFNISADRIYLHSELTGKYSPVNSLSSEELHNNLLH